LDEINTKWLPHLTEEVVSEIENNYLDSYVVALEGWRRGLTLRWHVKDSEKFKDMKTWFVDEPGQLFSLHSEERSHYFFRTRGDKVTNEAVELGMDKEKTKQILTKKGIPVPEGKQFSEHATSEEIVEYAKGLGFPVVIKPTDGSFGRGVMTNLRTVEEFTLALDYVRNDLEEKDIIVEKHIEGNDYRLYVVDDEVVGAILRIPPNVTGDGINSIEALIDIKNKERGLNPRLATTLIEINNELVDYIGRSGYTLQTVPEKGEFVYLSDKCNISIGGDPIDVLDDLSEEIKQLAVDALRAIPGLTHGAVDLMIEKAEDGTEQGFIIELNPTAQLGGILFPLKGKPRDVPKAIIDYYFPETKDVVTDKEKIYFDYYEVINPLLNNSTVSTQVSPYPVQELTGKHIIFRDSTYRIQDIVWLKNRAIDLGFHGFLTIDKYNNIHLKFYGKHVLIKKFLDEIKTLIHLHYDKVELKNSTAPQAIGFKIINEKELLNNDMENLLMSTKKLNKEHQLLRENYYELTNSFSWRITEPIRTLLDKLKSKKDTK